MCDSRGIEALCAHRSITVPLRSLTSNQWEEQRRQGQCILFSVVFTPPPSATTAVIDSYLLFLYSYLTVYRWYGLAYPYDWRVFVGTIKKTSVGFLVYIPCWMEVSVYSMWASVGTWALCAHHSKSYAIELFCTSIGWTLNIIHPTPKYGDRIFYPIFCLP